MLKKLHKAAIIVNEDAVPYRYDFLPKIKHIKQFKKNIRDISFDCLVVLDCSDLSRTGEVYRLNSRQKPVLNIDHHISNQRFGDINWVEPSASSCSEMIYRLYKTLHLPLDKDTAISLYAGILTDTGSFRYTNTKSFTHQAASELLKYNLDIPRIHKSIYEDIPLGETRLLVSILPHLKLCCQGKIAWFQIKRSMLKNKKLSFDLTESLLSFARAIKGVEAAALFKENLGTKHEIRINLRSHGKVDVNKIACFFGGGGHKTASGATVTGKLDSVRRKVLDKIKDSLS